MNKDELRAFWLAALKINPKITRKQSDELALKFLSDKRTRERRKVSNHGAS